MSKGKKIIIGILCAIAVLAIGILIMAAIFLNRIQYTDKSTAARTAAVSSAAASPSAEEEREDPVLEADEIDLNQEVEQTELTEEEKALMEIQKQEGDIVNILLIGVDRRGTDGNSRSDTMLIATLDKTNKRLKLTSIMRDLYVPIPGHGSNRINRSCNVGGPELVMETINENFSLDLSHYVMVDFKMFEQIVDQLGGITIAMSNGEVSEANDCIAGLNKQRGNERRDGLIKQRGGDVTLTGKQALGYARMRHFGNGDFARTSRQYKVLQEIFSEFKKANPAKQMQVLYDLLPMVETNLESLQIVSLATQALAMDTDTILYSRLPVEGTYKRKTIRGMWVLLPDISANTTSLHDFLYQASDFDPSAVVDTQAGSYHKKRKATPTPEPTIEETHLPEENIVSPEASEPIDSTPAESVVPSSSPDETADILVEDIPIEPEPEIPAEEEVILVE